MRHIYLKDKNKLYSFAKSSLVVIDNPRPLPVDSFVRKGTGVRVVSGEPIFYAGIAITNLCNLTCKHCPVSVTNDTSNRVEWSLDDFKTLIANLESRGLARVSITGGEPFLHSDIVGIFKILHEYGVESKLNSNGLMAQPNLVGKLIEYGLTEIDISVNDPSDDSDCYETSKNYAKDRIDSIAELVSYFNTDISVTASSVLTRRLIKKLSETSDRLYSAGARRWRLREMLPNIDRKSDLTLIPSLQELKFYLEKYIIESKPLTTYGYLFDIMQGVEPVRRCENLEKNYIYISYNGKCWWMAGLSGAALGDYHNSGLGPINDKLEYYMSNFNPPERCGTCPARSICLVSPLLLEE